MRHSQMFWAAFSWNHRTSLINLPGDLDAKRGGVISRVILQVWAEDHDVELMTWPPYSPDLNPIENVWAVLKQRICAKYTDLAFMEKRNDALKALYRAAFDMWEEIEVSELNALVEEMPRRVRVCFDAKGWYTIY